MASKQKSPPAWIAIAVLVLCCGGITNTVFGDDDKTPAPATTRTQTAWDAEQQRAEASASAAAEAAANLEDSPEPEPEETTSKPKKTRNTDDEPDDDEPDSVYYENCAAVRAAGAAPIRRGDPGYARHLDRDGDGEGCGGD
ncbi:excalibur calcium-binding domain-containing protein [Actinoplanes rectilineatus]|uniref:excalibur calcium-binding domain-containing protein n=1 Tax=Actinoplanes rectilineatus TaxID=113571 RepID=UPI000ABB4C61|nr:excalibur calcium-binding domain-containing protein [Actinoplanes rectilineatus]